MYLYHYIAVFVCTATYLVTLVTADDNQRQRHSSHYGHKDNPDVRWDAWTDWAPCSVDCGIGITSRSRDCRSMNDGKNTTGCIGKREEIKVCEITGCIRAVSDQCAELETRLFGGTRYRWEPYTHPRNACEIACRPVGAGFYLGLGKNVADGTVCDDDGGKVCISGRCRMLGCDGLVESGAEFDACGVCGGDGTSCTAVRKTFTDDVKYGYHTFATIPRGATNVFVSEAENSRNYLALKTSDGSFRLNTDFRLSRFGDRPGAGTLVSYARNTGPNCPDECIKLDGPIDVSLELMILAYTDNPGITYSYNVPHGQDFDSTKEEEVSPIIYIEGGSIPGTKETRTKTEVKKEKRPIFSYDFTFEKKSDKKHDPHGVDRGTNNRIGDSTNQPQTHDKYDETAEDNTEITTTASPVIIETKGPEKLQIAENDVTNKTDALHSSATGVISETDGELVVGDMYNKDNRIPSLYSWSVSGYTECSVTCGEGKQTAVIECLVTDKAVSVDEQYCSDIERPSAPPTPCDYGSCPPMWKADPWSKCSVTCGVGVQTRDYSCTSGNDTVVTVHECGASRPARDEQQCDMGSCTSGWYFTEWPDQCSSTCGHGTVKRDVVCMSNTGNELTACPPRSRPEELKSCRGDSCGRIWLAGPWSQCNATCGTGYQARDVVCAQRQGGRLTVVSDTGCDEDEKPTTYMSCDLPQCDATWFINDWGQCSVSCGMGYRSRDVRCLDAARKSSSECELTEKPKERDSCEHRTCPLSDQSSDTDKQTDTVTPRPPTPAPGGCVDRFKQCSMVLQSSLCNYKYYQNICCNSCKTVRKT